MPLSFDLFHFMTFVYIRTVTVPLKKEAGRKRVRPFVRAHVCWGYGAHVGGRALVSRQ